MISQQDKIDFYIFLYFDKSVNELLVKAVKRAYRDFSRTLRIPYELKSDKNNFTNLKLEWIQFISSEINKLLELQFNSQNDFDNWHKKVVVSLTQIRFKNFELKIGQSQKWINMTLKYLYIFGEKFDERIFINMHFFHIPIDNIIMDKIYQDFEISQIKPWSDIIDYTIYINYQKKFREKIKMIDKSKFPLFEEFKMFMK